MKKLNLKKKVVVAEETVTKDVDEIIKDADIKKFGYSTHVILSGKHKGKKAIIGVYSK